MCAFEKPTKDIGESSTFTPPTKAIGRFSASIARQASWSATRLDEQAVSIVILGPCRSKKYERRFAMMESDVPVMA